MKECKICKEIKHETDYYSSKASADRLKYECKTCTLKLTAKYRSENPLKIKEVNNKAYYKQREKRLSLQKEYYRKNIVAVKRIQKRDGMRKTQIMVEPMI